MIRANVEVAGIKQGMRHGITADYIPQLTICAGAQSPENDYRIVNSLVEFRIGTTPWRILSDDEIRWHFRLHTEVAAWLAGEFKNSWVWS